MTPLGELGVDETRGLRGLLFDLDDTLLTHGRLTREAYGALWDLHDAGLKLVAVTGRPCGWGEVIARQWPIDGAVTENGTAHVVRSGKGVELRFDENLSRLELAQRLSRLAAEVHRAFPEIKMADDAVARRTDIAWDIGERVTVPRETVDRLNGFLLEQGARTTRSSVHIHGTYDLDDKATGALRFLARELGVRAESAVADFAFVGDSPNDTPCFRTFRTTFGVANVRAHLADLPKAPRYVATEPMGAGFAEIARALLARRG